MNWKTQLLSSLSSSLSVQRSDFLLCVLCGSRARFVRRALGRGLAAFRSFDRLSFSRRGRLRSRSFSRARSLRAAFALDGDGDFDVHVAVQAHRDGVVSRLLERLVEVHAASVNFVAL